jgi:hypothetical protein
MPGDIKQYNTRKVLGFLMVSTVDSRTGVPGLVAGVTLIVTIGKNGGPLLPPVAAIGEQGEGNYYLEANPGDADTAGDLLLHAEGVGCDDTDDHWDVEDAIAPAAPGVPGPGGPVESRLGLDVTAVKLYLRVEHAADDGLIAVLLVAAKQAADNYLNAPFTTLKRQITLDGVVLGEQVEIADVIYTAAVLTDASEQEFAVGATDADTAAALVSCLNDAAYGMREAVAGRTGAVILLSWRVPQAETVEADSSYTSFVIVETMTEDAIPDAVAEWVLRRIGRAYERRADGLSAEQISALGAATWGPEEYSALKAYQAFLGL